jgi:hypothetical protein
MDLGMGYFYFLKSRMGFNTVRLVTLDEIQWIYGILIKDLPTPVGVEFIPKRLTKSKSGFGVKFNPYQGCKEIDRFILILSPDYHPGQITYRYSIPFGIGGVVNAK